MSLNVANDYMDIVKDKKRSGQHMCCHLVVYILVLNVLGGSQSGGSFIIACLVCVVCMCYVLLIKLEY